MENDLFTAKVTILVDKKWASNLEKDELQEYFKIRLNHALRSRGYVKKVNARDHVQS
ncbi:hypothetical protein ACFLXV_01825 [Chloroflexota bacterium]